MQKFWALGAPPPDPRASRGRGPCPHTPFLRRLGASPPDPINSPPNANFWLRPCSQFQCAMRESHPQVSELPFQILYLHLQQHTSARAAVQLLYISKRMHEIKGKLKMI